MKAFFDSTGGLWQSGALVGKPAGVFVSIGTQGGGMVSAASPLCCLLQAAWRLPYPTAHRHVLSCVTVQPALEMTGLTQPAACPDY